MIAAIRRFRTILDDRVRGSGLIADAIAGVFLATAGVHRWGRGARPALAMNQLQQALRFSRSSSVRNIVQRRYNSLNNSLTRADDVRTGGLAAPSVATGSCGEGTCNLTRSLIVKPPGPGGEKGVLFLGTEGDWNLLIRSGALRGVKNQYHLVAMAASAAPPLAKLHALGTGGDGPLHLGIANDDHYSYFGVLGTAIQPLPLMGCDWLDPASFRPLPREQRDIDIIVVASWLRLKRHWLVFKALRQLPATLNVVFVGNEAEGRTARHVQQEARDWGVRQQITYLEAIPNEKVFELQCASKVALQFSRREGAGVAVVESLLSDTPVGMIEGSYIGPLQYINAATGVRLRVPTIAAGVRAFLDQHASFAPRKWAERNVTYRHSLQRLETHLEKFAAAAGQPWSGGLVPVTRRYQQLRYADPADAGRMATAVENMERDHGIKLSPATPVHPAR
jgi:glycosyltransferase involved in cell wall biosynthesis